MAESTFEQLFGSCILDLAVPDTSIPFPDQESADDWLCKLTTSNVERKQAFFDEQLRLLLTVQVNHPTIPTSETSPDPLHPPKLLLDFLAHIQVTLEATYISEKPSHALETPHSAHLTAPPRSTSVGQSKPRPLSLHPSIFPPHTPNPIPSTAEVDRKYVQSEGTLLLATIWGQKASENERFTLIFSQTRNAWIAVYELSLVVSFLRLAFADPLLCLTISTTLRDKALSLSHAKHPYVAFISEKGQLSGLMSSLSESEKDKEAEITEDDDDLTGLEEVNLLDALVTDLNLSSPSEHLYLPSTRLGNQTRRQLFSLPPIAISPATPMSSSKRAPQNTLRKSFRKVMQTVSGFRVRMRTVFVPHVILPRTNSGAEGDESNSSREEREAGENERTVILCVEVENSGESGPGVGFSVEQVDVKISGDGASAKIIGWGESAYDPNPENRLFPLHIGSMEQYNLLYAVSFLNSPAELDNLSLAGHGQDTRSGPGYSDLQRAVTISIFGKPYISKALGGLSEIQEDSTLSYPTETFSSRWNCILDLSTRPQEAMFDNSDPWAANKNALPEPPSPFPGHSVFASAFPMTPQPKPHPQAIAGSKRHTLPGNIAALRAVNPGTSFRLSLPQREHSGSPNLHGKLAYTPPSITAQTYVRSPTTTFGMQPPTASMSGSFDAIQPALADPHPPAIPQTPAYPAFPPLAAVPPTPYSHPSISNQQGGAGPSVEIRRDRGGGMVPQTPGPTVVGNMLDSQEPPPHAGEPVVVSVGLLPPTEADSQTPEESSISRKIYPSEKFTLDIFVFNQSSWTRRFEVNCPDTSRQRRKKLEERKASNEKSTLEELKSAVEPPGILPLQNRVRVGPLRPSTCQSVRMDFLAVAPGLHSVDLLTLTDIETGFSVNLRSVMDVVVYERDK
ncbi:TRAPP trafficking subunit Trs65-domain-containing protein [Hygrophoropsis aurantiaca]|uniref:TRAPP trafficking subunit Trs65-domain-containing protein n=1 Tax=Hygrophoropsis aurantiaca TaxID=72124 RepID=A0ACB8ADA6_9AGAM|nr:TRAPP trafficking subunit Trs65-domain-containing protein [Hygrophoropsis aurantiaca]